MKLSQSGTPPASLLAPLRMNVLCNNGNALCAGHLSKTFFEQDFLKNMEVEKLTDL